MIQRDPEQTDPAVLYQPEVASMKEYLMIGTVLKPQGIRGECKIKSYAADISRFETWSVLYLEEAGEYRPVSVSVRRIRDGFVYACLDGCVSADGAERFRGRDLYVDRAHAALPEGDAVLIADLIGCRAVDETGAVLGTLTDVLQAGSVDTWVFDTGSGTLMAPALRAVFPSVDPEAMRIDVVRERLEEVAVRT